MARASDVNEQLLCSFCGKSQRQVKKLIAGPGVYICDECIDLCNEIISSRAVAEKSASLVGGEPTRLIDGQGDAAAVSREQPEA